MPFDIRKLMRGHPASKGRAILQAYKNIKNESAGYKLPPRAAHGQDIPELIMPATNAENALPRRGGIQPMGPYATEGDAHQRTASFQLPYRSNTEALTGPTNLAMQALARRVPHEFPGRQLRITSTKEGKHSPGSAHYSGQAIDYTLSGRDRGKPNFPDLARLASQIGFSQVRDELNDPSRWSSGPHVHSAKPNLRKLWHAMRSIERQGY
jgi:hypothetical protein